MAKNLAQTGNEKQLISTQKNHNKNSFQEIFKEGKKVLLKVKDFKLNNRKLCEEWKGPFIITKVIINNTTLIKTIFGKHDVET
jgi:hypothetical protein